jgi:hypothetical protein
MARAITTAQPTQTGLKITNGLTLAWPRSWIYHQEGNRDIRLDFLRGLCLFIIIANHIGYYPAFTQFITGGGYFLISAAEGFIFISGLVLGLVYGPRIIKEGLQVSTTKILHRAWTLYLWNIIIALAYLAIAYLTPFHTRGEAVPAPPAFTFDLVVKLVTLQQSFGWSDLLATYAILLAFAPVVFYALVQKKTKWVLGLSWAFWLGYQITPQDFSPTLGTFPIFAWQVLFINALVIGFHRESIKEFFGQFAKWKLYLPLGVTFLALLTFGVAWIYNGAFEGNADLIWAFQWAFDKLALRPGRMLTFIVFFLVFYLLLTYCWEPLRLSLGWLFSPLGQNSLYVYILHGFVVSLFFNIPDYGTLSPLVHTMGHIAAILLLWMLVKNKVLFKVIPR